MKITQNYTTRNDCYKIGQKIAVKGLMLHSIGTPQPSASVLVNNYNQPGVSACVHAFIDGHTGDVTQTLPWNYRGWHCGSGSNGSANNTHIGVEMCEPGTIRYTGGASFVDNNPTATKRVVVRTYNAAVELFAYLCKKYDLNPTKDGVIISHSEGHKRGIASNHGDVEHLWNKFGLTMDQFRKDVKAAMKGETTSGGSGSSSGSGSKQLYRIRKSWKNAKSQIGAYESLANAKKACKPGYTVYDKDGKAVYSKPESKFPYKVKIIARELIVREKADKQSKEATRVKNGEVFTITDEKKADGVTFGKLKSGAGWINLKYAKKV